LEEIQSGNGRRESQAVLVWALHNPKSIAGDRS